MSYLGNKNGPRESEMIERLGPDYFGITLEALENEILHSRVAESREEVVPVRIDENGQPFVLFSSPDKKGQRFYLLREGYVLQGMVACIDMAGESKVITF